MPHKVTVPDHHRNEKKGEPLLAFGIYDFLSRHYPNLSSKLEEYLLSEKNQYDAEIKKLEQRTAREDRSLWAISTLYPNTIRYSLFITLFQQFEFAMTETCHELEKDYPNSVKLSELSDKGIARAHTYLRKVAGISEPFVPTAWGKIKDLNALRNIIIHNDAIIKADEPNRIRRVEVVERINQWAPVTIRNVRIRLSETFIEHASRFLNEQGDYLGRKLIAAGWDR